MVQEVELLFCTALGATIILAKAAALWRRLLHSVTRCKKYAGIQQAFTFGDGQLLHSMIDPGVLFMHMQESEEHSAIYKSGSKAASVLHKHTYDCLYGPPRQAS